MTDQQIKSIRLDKWLKIARIIKTRNQAVAACDEGRVKVNDQIAKPAKLIKVGDVISIKFNWRTRTFDVLDVVQKSVKAEQARSLYHEHELTPEEKEQEELRSLFYQASKSQRPKFKGRPTKKERRELEKFRGRWHPHNE